MAVITDTFTKTVNIAELATVAKTITAAALVVGNSAMANADATALGPASHSETFTDTAAVVGVGSTSVSESLSATSTPFLVLLPPIL